MACWAHDDSIDTLPAPAFGAAKRCGCGATYDEDGWRALPYVGAMPDVDGGEPWTLRNCVFCRSTLARRIGDEVGP